MSSVTEVEPSATWVAGVAEYAPLREQPRHCHDTASITLILSGEIEETTRLGTRRSPAYNVVVKPAGVFHSDVYGPRGARTFRLDFLSGSVAQLVSLYEYRWYEGGPVAKSMLAIFDIRRTNATRDDIVSENGLIDLFACIVKFDRFSDRATRPEWMDDLMHRLRGSGSQTMSVRHIADEVRMHPVSLARAFRRHQGCSITEFIRRRRILKACELMGEESQGLAEIALVAGFSDQPHFTRTFKVETGLTPTRFRRAAN